MATRFYLPASGTAPASPAYDANWERQFTSWTRRPLVRSKSNTALATLSEAYGATATSQKLYAQWISETLNVDQTISGTVSMVVGKCAETTTNGDAHLAFSLRVLKSDGTFRGTLLLYHATSTEFPLVASAATRIHSARAITSLACLAGDRLVLEIGLHTVTPANEVMQMRFGDPSATGDFALTAALTTDLCPWMELSQTITFGTPPVNVTVSLPTLSGVGSPQALSVGAVRNSVVSLPTLSGLGGIQAASVLSVRNVVSILSTLQGIGSLQGLSVNAGMDSIILLPTLDGRGAIIDPQILQGYGVSVPLGTLSGVGSLQTPTVVTGGGGGGSDRRNYRRIARLVGGMGRM